MRFLQPFIGWFLEERRLADLATWSDGAYDNRPTPDVFTRRDPRCRAVEIRQRVVAQQLRLEGVAGPRVPISAGWEHDERAFRFVRRS